VRTGGGEGEEAVAEDRKVDSSEDIQSTVRFNEEREDAELENVPKPVIEDAKVETFLKIGIQEKEEDEQLEKSLDIIGRAHSMSPISSSAPVSGNTAKISSKRRKPSIQWNLFFFP